MPGIKLNVGRFTSYFFPRRLKKKFILYIPSKEKSLQNFFVLPFYNTIGSELKTAELKSFVEYVSKCT